MTNERYRDIAYRCIRGEHVTLTYPTGDRAELCYEQCRRAFDEMGLAYVAFVASGNKTRWMLVVGDHPCDGCVEFRVG